MKKAVLVKNKLINIIETVKPKIKDDECLVKVAYCGICSSDIDRIYNNTAYFYPLTLGHEISGTIEKVGKKVSKFKLNDRIAVFPLIPCNKCIPCKNSQFNQCKNYKYYGSRNDGGYSQYVKVKEWNLFKINKTITLKDAALIEPLSVCFHAIDKINKLKNLKNKNILILGAGFLGLLISKILKSTKKNNTVTMVDKNQYKLRLAKKYCKYIKSFNNFIKVNESDSKYDVIIEATGSHSSFISTINLCSRNGIILWMGNIGNDLNISKNIVSKILRKELTIIGSWNSNYKTHKNDDWKKSLSFLRQGYNISEFISHEIKLSQISNHTKKIYKHKKNLKKFKQIKTIISLVS